MSSFVGCTNGVNMDSFTYWLSRVPGASPRRVGRLSRASRPAARVPAACRYSGRKGSILGSYYSAFLSVSVIYTAKRYIF